MRDHRCSGEVKPEGDIRPTRLAFGIAHVPAHRCGKDAKAADQQQWPDRILHIGDGGEDQADRSGDQCGRPGGDGDRHHEAAPVQPRGGGGGQADARDRQRPRAIAKVRHDGLHALEQTASDTADEGDQQQDAGQRHSAFGGEIFREHPCRARDEHATERTGKRGADLPHRDEQQHDRDRDEDVVEASEQTEMLFVHRRCCVRRGDVRAQRRRGVGGDRPRRHRAIDVAFAIHGDPSPSCRSGEAISSVLFVQHTNVLGVWALSGRGSSSLRHRDLRDAMTVGFRWV